MRERSTGCMIVLGLIVFSVPAAARSQERDVFTEECDRLRLLLKSPVTDRRIEGVRGLECIGHHIVEQDLLPLLKDPDTVVRRETVRALAKCGRWQSIPVLIHALNDPAWDVREHAHLSLRAMLARDEGPDAKNWLSWWNASSREQQVSHLLADLKTNDVERRKKALVALKRLASKEQETAILEYVRSQPKMPGDERNLGIQILEWIGTEQSVPYLAGHAKGGNPWAAWALGGIGGPEAEKALLAGANRGRYPNQVSLINLDRVHSTGCEPLFPKLLYAFGLVTFRSYPDDLEYPAMPVQRAAGNLIVRTGKSDAVVDAILGELEGKPRQVKGDLRQVLEAMRAELKKGFVRNDGQTTSQPLAALPHIVRDKKFVPRLIPLLRHQAYVPRVYVAMTLGRLRAQEAIPEMAKIIEEGYPFSDSTAVASGKHFKRSQTIRWRGYFAIALGYMDCAEARLALERFAADTGRSRDTRYGAVVGLDFMGAAESLPVLRKVTAEDVIWMIRQRASEAIENIEFKQQEARSPK